MGKTARIRENTRCFFANISFHAGVCDSNHKKRLQKSSTIPTAPIFKAHSMVRLTNGPINLSTN